MNSSLPMLPGLPDYVNLDIDTGGQTRNRDYFTSQLSIDRELSSLEDTLLFDPQTAGGLLIALPAAEAARARTRAEAVGAARFCVACLVHEAFFAAEPEALLRAAGATEEELGVIKADVSPVIADAKERLEKQRKADAVARGLERLAVRRRRGVGVGPRRGQRARGVSCDVWICLQVTLHRA